MSPLAWAKLDDQFHRHPKALEAWHLDPVAIGLWAMTLSWAASNTDTDSVPEGFASGSFVRMLLPEREDRQSAVQALVSAGLWEPVEGGWQIHDYLDRNRSRAQYRREREDSRKRMEKSRRNNGPVAPQHNRPVPVARTSKKTSSLSDDKGGERDR